MSGMDLPGLNVNSGPMTGMPAPAPPGPAGWPIGIPCLVLAVGFAAAAIWLVVSGLRERGRGPGLRTAVAGGLMAAGMAVTFADLA